MVIVAQETFVVGGTQFTQSGSFDIQAALKADGQTYHEDHAYTFYQITAKERAYPLVFLHGEG